MSKDRYIFPALFEYAEDGISVSFPDLPGCFTCGDTTEHALQMAKEALALHLYGMEDDLENIPNPTEPTQLKVDQQSVIILVEVWMPPFRSEMRNQSVKKTLTIPRWLDDIARDYKINYSYLLQEAIKEELGMSDKKI